MCVERTEIMPEDDVPVGKLSEKNMKENILFCILKKINKERSRIH
jgi:hypothetical protein